MTPALHEPITKPEAPPETSVPKDRVAFAGTEIEDFKSADWKAGAMVAGLMVAIFTVGLIIYLIVFACAMAGPP